MKCFIGRQQIWKQSDSDSDQRTNISRKPQPWVPGSPSNQQINQSTNNINNQPTIFRVAQI